MRATSDVLQRRRARGQKRIVEEYRENRERTQEEPARVVWSRLSGVRLLRKHWFLSAPLRQRHHSLASGVPCGTLSAS